MADITTYGRISRLNHWLLAIGMLSMVSFGLFLSYAGLSPEEKGPLVAIHRAVGVLVFVLGLWRVSWRLFNGFPTEIGNMPYWQSILATFVHCMLLLAILFMPISGLLATLFQGIDVSIFGLFTIPALTENEAFATAAFGIHSLLSKIAIVIVLVHVAGALKHHFIDSDATLLRMLTGRVTRKKPSSQDL